MAKVLMKDWSKVSELLFEETIRIRRGRDGDELTFGEVMEIDNLLQLKAKIDEMLEKIK